jgi:hypothetical protein
MKKKKKLWIAQSEKDPGELRRKANGTRKVVVCNCGDINLTTEEGPAVKKTMSWLKEALKEGSGNSGKGQSWC